MRVHPKPKLTQSVSRLHGLWLVVFAFEALNGGRGLAHQLGGAVLGTLFAILVVTEIRSHRQAHRHLPPYGPALGVLHLREQDRPRSWV